MKERTYICIDLKSFYASVECVERGLDPMNTNLVVADPERSEKTICLAITPAMKKLGIKNRCRVFEIPKEVSYITAVPRMQKYIDYAAEIYEITGTANSAVLHIKSIKPEIASKLSSYFGNRFVLNALNKPVYTIRLSKGQKMSQLVAELGKAL